MIETLFRAMCALLAVALLGLVGCATPSHPPEYNVIQNDVTRQLKIEPVQFTRSATGTTQALVRFTNTSKGDKLHVEVRANFKESARIDGSTAWRHLFLEPGQVQEYTFLSATPEATLIKVDVK